MNNNPIGIFDSGIGGLSIAKGIIEQLPAEDLIYVADLAFAPYGTKPVDLLERRAAHIVQFLINNGAKAIVVACNTVTVNIIGYLRAHFDIPFIGVEPAVKPASISSQSGVIGVLATEQTLKSSSFNSLVTQYAHQVEVHTQACPRLVELVEEGDFDSELAIKTIQHYIDPLIIKMADQIVLGCTHYSFLKPQMEKIYGDKATILDVVNPVAKELKRRLTIESLLKHDDVTGQYRFWTTGYIEQAHQKISNAWGEPVKVRLVDHPL